MNPNFERRLAAAANIPLLGGLRGIEKESLRVTRDGLIAATPHPAKLGSALTHRYITTDYSEALPELVTPPVETSWQAIQFLCDLHQFVYASIGDELLWAASMPCRLRSEEEIPLAQYGDSNIAWMKTIYRRGLGYRYGRFMQTIAGIHFNYSLPAAFWPAFQREEKSIEEPGCFQSNRYLGLVRNVRRLDWLLLYLFGASPAVCSSFVADAETSLESFDDTTLYYPHATSLRMSHIGYQNDNQSRLIVSANSVDEYVADLSAAVRTPFADYEKIGVRVDGEYRQLSANLLQIENEYYSTIRPKRVARSAEHPTEALRRRGVEYIELRALDISPFDPVGISRSDTQFLEAFLIYCLLDDSPKLTPEAERVLAENRSRVAVNGRRPGLLLSVGGERVRLTDRGCQVMEGIVAVARLLDEQGGDGYVGSVEDKCRAIENPDLTPSARLLSELAETGQSMSSYGLQLSAAYRDYFDSLSPNLNGHWELLAEESRDSIQRQQTIERDDSVDFDTYLANYFSPERIPPAP